MEQLNRATEIVLNAATLAAVATILYVPIRLYSGRIGAAFTGWAQFTSTMNAINGAVVDRDEPEDEEDTPTPPPTQLPTELPTGNQYTMMRRSFVYRVGECIEQDMTRAETIKALFGYDSTDGGGAYTAAGKSIDEMIAYLKSTHKLAADWTWPIAVNRNGRTTKVKG